ncbi:hypothetical protein FEE95_07965 [Maribacter algarum]|uniref:Outer membrane protein beta-barrel domain-containing protein n=1 Tax=Maribacter algarum (ex Zhang et al. 2020) TaxID=2578118 RepID=A0A5S3Q190_9FLAO|nr:hypothetical protein [Maribacter algarum]TMM59357.1 hypothetical protein FEE95_07965 [Maribacter algarum]
MKSFKLVCLLFLMGTGLFAQKSESKLSSNTNSYITASLWPIADLYAPRLRFGYTQHIAPHWKAGLDVGFGAKGTSFASDANIGVDYSLWEVRPEIHYIFNPEAKTLKYIAAELFYIDQDHVFINGNYSSENNGDIRFDRADFTRQKYGMHFKFGLFLDIGKHFGFNFFGGIGFRIANKQYSNVINPQADDIFREWFAGPYDNEGRDFLPNPSLGIKFYYKI